MEEGLLLIREELKPVVNTGPHRIAYGIGCPDALNHINADS